MDDHVRIEFSENVALRQTFFHATGPLLCVTDIGHRGTPEFSSPELLTGMLLYDKRKDDRNLQGEMRDVAAADVWSVGAIIYNAATGDLLVPKSSEEDSAYTYEARSTAMVEGHEIWKVSQCAEHSVCQFLTAGAERLSCFCHSCGSLHR